MTDLLTNGSYIELEFCCTVALKGRFLVCHPACSLQQQSPGVSVSKAPNIEFNRPCLVYNTYMMVFGHGGHLFPCGKDGPSCGQVVLTSMAITIWLCFILAELDTIISFLNAIFRLPRSPALLCGGSTEAPRVKGRTWHQVKPRMAGIKA